MASLINTKISPRKHIARIFKSFEASARVLESFTNLSNTVIDTALSGQSKFILEILQNADDSCRDPSKHIVVQFNLEDNYFIIQHNGKEFDFYDVERICDYASQIKEVKARDLNKTGYKGLGFKSLFNLSKCIYICSGGYSFRFDKSSCSNPDSVPWQVIPIWSDKVPLSEKYNYDESVNFILKIKKAKQMKKFLLEIITRPEFFLYLRHVKEIRVNIFGEKHILEKKVEKFESFEKYCLYENQLATSFWLSGTYISSVPADVQNIIRKGSKYTYPDKIKEATEISITFTLKTDGDCKEIIKINDGLCFSTLPTQLNLMLPYHVNSFFVLNLDRTQLDENDWNEYLLEQTGYLQMHLLRDLAGIPCLKNFVVELFTRKIHHPYNNFTRAFCRGLYRALKSIAWLPSQGGSSLLKIGDAWVDEIQFFKQDFKDIRDEIYLHVIDYDVKYQHYLNTHEAKRFTYDQLLNDFAKKHYPQLNEESYVRFLTYLYTRLKTYSLTSNVICKLRDVAFLRTKNDKLLSPTDAFLEAVDNPIPDFFELNPIDNKYLPLTDTLLFRDWLVFLGVKEIYTTADILRESLLKWIESNNLDSKITIENHVGIINYLAGNVDQLTKKETDKLRENLIIFTKSKEFRLIKICYLPNTLPTKELEEIISDNEKIAPIYNMSSLKDFIIHLNILNKITPIKLLRKSILEWIKNGEINQKLNEDNYKPIVDYFASQYSKIEDRMTEYERLAMKKMPVLTRAQIFQKADVCYFDSALPDISGFENVISEDNLVNTKDISRNVCEFLAKIGVSKELQPVDIIRKSVLKWVREDTIQSQINHSNHQSILKYIAANWRIHLSELEPAERNYFYKFPVLTENNTFKEANLCYWQPDNVNRGEKIPHIESIISSNDYISSEYSLPEIKNLLHDFGVRSLTFDNVYEKYCNHLISRENIEWFFSHLIKYWEYKKRFAYSEVLLTDIREKLKTVYLLAKNGHVYHSTDLYSFRFSSIHSIDPDSLPLLEFENMPEELERFLGFKFEIKMPCFMKLFEAFDEKQKKKIINQEETLAFFTILLEQLRCKKKNEIEKYQVKLLSQANELKNAKDLYYFKEKNSKCRLNELYLKRICGMSHEHTLELATMCGVNIVPFHIRPIFEDSNNASDKDTLKYFYLKRLPFIILKESKERNDYSLSILNRLFNDVCSIELFECQKIFVSYPFGEPVEERRYFIDLKLYVKGDWIGHNSYVHKHIKEKLCLEADDIDDIINMRDVSEETTEDWLKDEKEDRQLFCQIEKQIEDMLSVQEKSKIHKHILAQNSRKKSTENIDNNEESGNLDSAESRVFVKRLEPEIVSLVRPWNDNAYYIGSKHSIYADNPVLNVIETEVQRNRSMSETAVTFTENVTAEYSHVLPGLKIDKSYLQRNNESYVFTFLQDFYKKKYPNASYSLFNGYFTLNSESHKIDIIWLNESGDKELPYDLKLKKDGETKQVIEVLSSNKTMGDFFSINHRVFLKQHKIITDKEKYSVYCVFNTDGSISTEGQVNPFFLYKIVPLKIP